MRRGPGLGQRFNAAEVGFGFGELSCRLRDFGFSGLQGGGEFTLVEHEQRCALLHQGTAVIRPLAEGAGDTGAQFDGTISDGTADEGAVLGNILWRDHLDGDFRRPGGRRHGGSATAGEEQD